MRVVVITAFGPYSKGHVIPDMPGNQARGLMARNLVREATVDEYLTEDVPAAPADRMMRPQGSRQPRAQRRT